MPLNPTPFKIEFDFSNADWDTGSPSYTDYGGDVQLVTMLGMNRERLPAMTADFIVNTVAGGAYNLPVTIKFIPSAVTFIKSWNAAVDANAAISYKFTKDKSNAAGATNPEVWGALMPTDMIMPAPFQFGGHVEQEFELQPGGVEPYIKVVTDTTVYFGKA